MEGFPTGKSGEILSPVPVHEDDDISYREQMKNFLEGKTLLTSEERPLETTEADNQQLI